MVELATTVQRSVESDITTVLATGRLSLLTAAQLRATLMKAIADCPVGVIVDVSACRPDTSSALTVFSSVAQHATEELGESRPSVALALCGANDAFRTPRARSALGQIRIFGSWLQAIEAIEAGAAGQRRINRRIPQSLDAPGEARDTIEAVCDDWGVGELRHAASVIVSELVTNAVVHAGSGLLLEAVMRGDFLHLRVHDGSPVPPIMYDGELTDHGNGLRIVANASSAWGFVADSRTGGKVVWATLRARPVGSPKLAS